MLSTETEVVQMYNHVFRTVIAEQTDAIFFVREVSPLRL
jgi:hypothetical protein